MAHEIGSIPELIERLSRGPDLEGLVEYGSAPVSYTHLTLPTN